MPVTVDTFETRGSQLVRPPPNRKKRAKNQTKGPNKVSTLLWVFVMGPFVLWAPILYMADNLHKLGSKLGAHTRGP